MSRRNDEKIRVSSKIWKSLEEEEKDGNEGAPETKHDGQENLFRYVSRDRFPVVEAGNYYLGPVVKKYVRNPVTQCLARRRGTDGYYLMKILILRDGNLKDKFHLHRRAVFHTEFTILSLLKGHPGVIQLHDFFKDSIPVEDPAEIAKGQTELKRMCMVLECLIPHGCHNAELTPLPEYLAEKRRLSETEALHIFANILLVIDDLHKRNIVHKDLKLSNIILNRRTLKIKLINFYYAKLLSSENEVSYNQRGNPSYTSPDVIAGKPVAPKPCDMWSTGVILYTMLHGYLPFIRNPNWGSALANTRALADLYAKIITNDYVISNDITVSDGTKRLLRGLLSKDPQLRLKASEAVDMTSTVLALQSSSQFPCSQYSDQIVPECPRFEQSRGSPSSCSECWLIVNAKVPNVASKTYKIAISEVDGKATAKGSQPKAELSKTVEEQDVEEADNAVTGKSEKDVLARSSHGKIVSRRNSMSRNNKIKFAMLRLGATSVNNISALSFNYSDRNTSRSQM